MWPFNDKKKKKKGMQVNGSSSTYINGNHLMITNTPYDPIPDWQDIMTVAADTPIYSSPSDNGCSYDSGSSDTSSSDCGGSFDGGGSSSDF